MHYSKQEPPKPAPTPVTVGMTYTYQGRGDMSGKQVRVLAHGHNGDASLASVVVLKGKAQDPTDTTFGCDPRWLALPGERSAFAIWDAALRKFQGSQPLKNQQRIAQGIEDPDQFDQAVIWEQ